MNFVILFDHRRDPALKTRAETTAIHDVRMDAWNAKHHYAAGMHTPELALYEIKAKLGFVLLLDAQ